MADLRAIATDLYARPLAEFIEARTELAADVDDKDLAKQIRAFRKPSAAAWAVNALSREEPDLLQEILDLGEQLRDAQSDSDGSRTRLLDRTRRELTTRAVAEASTLAGSLSAPAAAGVEETLRAAMTDPDAGAAVQDGLLVTTFAASPFEPVDLTDVVALPVAGSRPARRTPAKASVTKLDDKRREKAEAAVETANSKAQAAADDVEAKLQEHERLLDELADLRERAAQLEREITDTERDARLAKNALDRSEQAEESAQRQATEAGDRLRELH